MQTSVKKVSKNLNISGYEDETKDDGTALEEGEFNSYLVENSELEERNKGLRKKLDQKNREIENLCTLLEAVEPIPGFDVEKYRHMVESTLEEPVVDYRDAKIVQLAKKCRKLTITINKDNALLETRASQIEELKSSCERLKKELDTSMSHTEKNAAAAAAAGSDPIATAEKLRKEVHASNKTIEDLRHKNFQMSEENKSLSRALAKEIGDGVSIEEAVKGGSWKGRSQQIVMLKAKIKRLESSMSTDGGNTGLLSTSIAEGKSITTQASIANHTNRRGGSTIHDVDSKAEGELEYMSRERNQAVETLIEERARLYEECQQLETKCQGQKARIKNLEQDSGKQKQQLKILIEKTETDDQLITALREELQRMRQSAVHASKQARLQEQNAVIVHQARPGGGVAPAAANPGMEAEIQRLTRLCKQQAAQLSTQDDIIKGLRGSAHR